MTLEKHGPGGTSDLGRPLTASADPVDRVVRLAPTWTLFALVASGVLVVGIVVWALTGTVSSTVTSPGILHDIGATTVRATASGQVDRVPVTVGDMVKTGQVVPGQSVVIVADLTIDPLVVTKVAPSYISTMRVGLPVRMEVEGAPASRYGYLVGTISDITNNPYSNAQIAARLGIDQQVVASELGDAPGLLAVVRLQPDRSTPTGFAWTVGQGPSLIAQQGVMITVHTVLKESSPLGMVFPQFAPR